MVATRGRLWPLPPSACARPDHKSLLTIELILCYGCLTRSEELPLFRRSHAKNSLALQAAFGLAIYPCCPTPARGSCAPPSSAATAAYCSIRRSAGGERLDWSVKVNSISCRGRLHRKIGVATVPGYRAESLDRSRS